MKPVLITTKHRGVFAGLLDDKADRFAKNLELTECRMAIYWGTTKGVLELADTGPTSKSRISAKAETAMIRDITAIFDITTEAWKKWTTS